MEIEAIIDPILFVRISKSELINIREIEQFDLSFTRYVGGCKMKQVIRRSMSGLLMGISYGYVITIIISLTKNDGNYYPVVPALSAHYGSELLAVVIQTICCGVLGAVSGASSLIWLRNDWSILKQNLLHFAIMTCSVLPIAYVTFWMEHTTRGILSYVGIFLGIYIVIGLTQYMVWRRKLRKLNRYIER